MFINFFILVVEQTRYLSYFCFYLPLKILSTHLRNPWTYQWYLRPILRSTEVLINNPGPRGCSRSSYKPNKTCLLFGSNCFKKSQKVCMKISNCFEKGQEVCMKILITSGQIDFFKATLSIGPGNIYLQEKEQNLRGTKYCFFIY